MDYSALQLEMAFRLQLLEKRIKRAVVKIQAWFRMFLVRRKYLPMLKKRNRSLQYIQTFYRFRLKLKASLREKKKAATIIQKYLRGYIQCNRIMGPRAS